MKSILFALCLLLFGLSAAAQVSSYADTKEKVYAHTDHVFYKPGDRIYFKVYVVRAKDHRISKLSKTVYAELFNPSGTRAQQLNLSVTNGYAEGAFNLDAEATGGVYKLKVYTNWMRNESEERFFVKELTVQKVLSPRILMKLDFPRKGYRPGDTVHARFSARTLSDAPLSFKGASYKVSIGGQEQAGQAFTTDKEGKALLQFNLPVALSTNDGLLNITLNHDGFTESISRSVPINLGRIDLQWMPEGGTMVEGLPAAVAFKALNEWGKPADVQGSIFDDKGKRVSSFASFHAGMGRLEFVPLKGRTYHAKIEGDAFDSSYVLPKAAAEGLVMQVKRSKGTMKTYIHSTSSREVWLEGSARDRIIFSQRVALNPGVDSVAIPEALFPQGICQLLVMTPNRLPLSERLVFLNYDHSLRISIRPEKNKYAPREEVELSVHTTDSAGRPLPANLSLSVVDDKLWTMADDKTHNVQSWLLLGTELHGVIDEPSFYFNKEEAKAREAIDLLMLTHGYRYYNYTELVLQKGTLQYQADAINVLTGKIADEKGQAVEGRIYLLEAAKEGAAIYMNTNSSGSFKFTHLKPGVHYYLFAIGKRSRMRLKVHVEHNGIDASGAMGAATGEETGATVILPVNRTLAAAIKDAAREADPVDISMFNAWNNLDEVVVTGYTASLKKQFVGAVSMVRASEIGLANFDGVLQGRAPGLIIRSDANGAAQYLIRGAASLGKKEEPLFVINGTPVQHFEPSSLNVQDIESVTVLKDAAAAATYGSRGAYGVIVIETKKNSYYMPRGWNINLKQQQPLRYRYIQAPGAATAPFKGFYAPRYTSTYIEERSDFRETIYWNGVVQTDENGKATLKFYNSDATTTFRIVAEGIGYEGSIGREEKTYTVQQAMQVDLKIPPYLTIGDTAYLPLVVRNNREKTMDVQVDLSLPDHLLVRPFNPTLRVEGNSSARLLIPVYARDVVHGKLRVGISSDFGKERFSYDIEAAQKGFPGVQAFKSSGNDTFKLHLPRIVGGSLKTTWKVYHSLEGSLLNDIEAMLREPYGCFEQTSSTTYPNVFVLKYLRESGNSNPEVETKAIGYIQRGYDRLKGFETALHGFEWFGKTPPHEALTAYGLMEFTDMKGIIKVDEEMLERTSKFLLSRRDGLGGFKLAGGGYDQFASVPNAVANTYIVYALTHAGMGSSIRREYDTAVARGLRSGDAYLLSMTALAADNLKQTEDYKKLMLALKDLKGLPSQTTVVNSRGASLRVETMAMYVLAMLRDPRTSAADVAPQMEAILNERSYYGYGSTQSTVLALKAVIEYSKRKGKQKGEGEVKLFVNGNEVDGDALNEALKDGDNVVVVQCSGDAGSLPYYLEAAYHTETPNSDTTAPLALSTALKTDKAVVGETVRMNIVVSNREQRAQPMVLAKIGLPAGLSLQPWQLKELIEKKEIAYYEIFDNYLVLYWMGMAKGEVKKLALDLKAEVPGLYKAKASTAYLYYTPESKVWVEGTESRVVNGE